MTDQNPKQPEITLAATDVPRLYVNAVAVRGGSFDVSLDLGFAVPGDSPDQPAPAPEWLARMTMSWEHAASLMRILEGAIKQYEDQVGPLPDVEKAQVQS
jgi:hypothetical protein